MSGDPRRLGEQARQWGLVARWNAVPDLGLVLAAGPDCLEFLQARLTSDVRALAPGQGQLSCKLTGRGQLVSYFSLHRLPERGQPFPSFFLLLNRNDVPVLLEDLEATLIGEDVLLEDVSTQFEGVLAQGPEASALLEQVLGRPEPDEVPEYSLRVPESLSPGLPTDLLILARSFTGDPGRLLLWGTGSSKEEFTDQFLDSARRREMVVLDAEAASRTAWRWLTVDAGWLCLGRDLEPARVVLPQTGLEQQVVSATKGCFPGQEVVARIRTYGSVPTALRGLEFEMENGPAPGELPGPGRALKMAGKKIGSWATGAWSPTRKRTIALAFLDRDHRTPGTRLEVETDIGPVAAEVLHLPFYQAANHRQRARHLYEQAIRLFSGGDDLGAVDLLEEALRLDPRLPEAYEALGVILGRSERYLQAIDIFRRLEEVAPHEPMVHTNLSLFYMKIGDKEEAERQKAKATLKRFAGTDPAEARAMERMASAARQDEARRKIGMFNAVLDIDPADPLALMGMGKALAELEDFDQAEKYLAEALRIQVDNSSLYAARGKVLEALQRPAEAAEIYRRGVVVASLRGDFMPLKDMEHRLGLLDVE
jgi:folate-binding protein YgfZ